MKNTLQKCRVFFCADFPWLKSRLLTAISAKRYNENIISTQKNIGGIDYASYNIFRF